MDILAYVLWFYRSLGNVSQTVVQLLKVRDGFPRDEYREGAPGYREYSDMGSVFEWYKSCLAQYLKQSRDSKSVIRPACGGAKQSPIVQFYYVESDF